jgi:hypothetical protein
MTGQPQLPPWLVFNVTTISASEIDDHDTVVNIIDQDVSSFQVHAHFDGSGIIWGWLKALGAEWEIVYSAEKLGVGPDMELGTVTGTLTPANDSYGYLVTRLVVPPNTVPVGLYKLSCIVRFPLLHGLNGHVADGPVIELF